MRSAILVSLAILIALGLFGCQGFGGSKPTVIVNSPPSGSSFGEGDDVPVQSTANDSQGVTRLELQVDGVTVRTDSSPVAQGQSQFIQIQTWKAAGVGNHTIVVRAFNASGAFADAGITIEVKQSAAALVTETPAIATVVPPPTLLTIPTLALPTNTPIVSSPTPVPPTSTPAPVACSPNSQYLADMTIPDGTIVQPGAAFVKTWRVRNSGTCAWDASYSIAFTGGTPFVIGAAPIPPAAPGAIVDISLTMSAPVAFGPFMGTWRLRGPDGAFFGTNLTTAIVVPNPNPPPSTNTPSPTITNTPLPGAPHISSFTCSPCTIASGGSSTLSWGLVTNATNVSIDQGIGGVATPGNRNVSPAATTTYTLTASGPGGTTQASVVVIVAGNFAGHWEHNFGFMDLTQNGASVTGTYHNSSDGGNGTVAGTVSGNILTGTYQKNTTGSIQFSLGGGGNTFTGNWNGVNQWCGARSGVSFPSGCAFDGHWNTRYNPAPGVLCSMDLSQVGSSVTGTYCNGSIQGGVITYSGGYVVLSGTWRISASNSGPFVFYLSIYNSQQFQGHYSGSTDWCGWRNGSSQPSPCEK